MSTQPVDDTRQYGVSFNGQHDFTDVKFVSITAYRNTRFTLLNDADQGPLNLGTTNIRQNR